MYRGLYPRIKTLNTSIFSPLHNNYIMYLLDYTLSTIVQLQFLFSWCFLVVRSILVLPSNSDGEELNKKIFSMVYFLCCYCVVFVSVCYLDIALSSLFFTFEFYSTLHRVSRTLVVLDVFFDSVLNYVSSLPTDPPVPVTLV